MVEPPSFFCYFFEDLPLSALVQISCLVKVPFLFLMPISTQVGDLFTVQPGKQNFLKIANHFSVCGGVELAWSIPKLGGGL